MTETHAARWALACALLCTSPALSAETSALCPITVEFGSYCCGPDLRTVPALETVLQEKQFRGVRVDLYSWGLEGESTWCIYPLASKDALAVSLGNAISAQVPLKGGPTPEVHLERQVRGNYLGPLVGSHKLR